MSQPYASTTVTIPPKNSLRAWIAVLCACLLACLIALTPVSPAAAAPSPANAPSGLSATYYGGVGTVLTWKKSSSKDVVGYKVYRSTSSKVTTDDVLIADTAELTATDTQLTTQTKYRYAVLAYTSAGVSSKFSPTQTVTTTDRTAPKPASALKATASIEGITLKWKGGSEPDFAGFRIQRVADGHTAFIAENLKDTTFLDADAPVGTKSTYKIYSVDLSGNSSSATSTSATRTQASATTVPRAVTSLTATATEAGVKVTWRPSSLATSYSIERRSGSDGQWEAVATGVTALEHTHSAAAGTWTYRVFAVNTAGPSPAATVTVTVKPDTKAPSTPSGTRVTYVPGGGITVTWRANKEADLAGYIVYKRAPKGTTPRTYERFLPAEGALAATTFTDENAIEGTTNYYRIRAVDTSGNLSSYTAITAAHRNVAPAAPTNLKVTAGTEHGLVISFTPPKDVDVAGYALLRSIEGSTFSLVNRVTVEKAGPAPSIPDTSAPKGVNASYRVVAIDRVGNESKQSGTVSGTSTTDPIPVEMDYAVITVGPSGDFTTLGAAITALPKHSVQPYRIDLAPGVYEEKLTLNNDWVTLRGTGAKPADVRITSSTASGTPDPARPGETYGTSGSATLYVKGANVTLENLTVANDFDEAANPQITSQQAVALRVVGDRFQGLSVRLIGNQDTLLVDTVRTTARARAYFVNSYIEGDVDYVFGAMTAVFDRTTFKSLDRGRANNGFITAASTNIGNKFGFLITDSKVTSPAADGTVHLGRPWHPSADKDAIGSVVIRNTWLPSAIDTVAPWEDMSATDAHGDKIVFSWKDARFHEYANVGPGAGEGENRPMLTDKEAAKHTAAAYLAGKDGWNPVLPATVGAVPTAATGLIGSTDLNVAHLTWDDSESVVTTHWRVERAGEDGIFAPIGIANAPQYSDWSASTGSTYTYRVVALSRDEVAAPPSSEVTLTITEAAHAVDAWVDPAGVEDATHYRTLTAALAGAPAGTLTDPTVIQIAAGTYEEYPTIARSYTQLVGATGNAADVVLTGSRASGMPTGEIVDGVPATYGTSGSASVVITGSNVELRDLTVENSYVEGTYEAGQAVALRTTGDRLVYRGVRLIGNQDTLYANSPASTQVARTYIVDSWIEGDVDFVFGRGTVVIDRSTMWVTDHGTTPNGAVTAASTDESNSFGFLVNNSRIIGAAPNGSQDLGRPWQPGILQADGVTSIPDARAKAQVTVRDTWLGPIISSGAWTFMVNSGQTTPASHGRFFEYNNSGPGAAVVDEGGAAPEGRPQLSSSEAEGYTPQTYLAGRDGWNPVRPVGVDTAPAAPTGLVAAADDGVATLTWDAGTEADVVEWKVLRSSEATPGEGAVEVATVTRSSYTDRGLANGTSYTYEVVAVDRAGQASPSSSPVSVMIAEAPLVPTAVVAQDGSGTHTSVQAALDAVPAGTAAEPTVVLIKAGTYREVISTTKSDLLIVGETGAAADVVITFDNANGTAAGPDTCPSVTTATCGTAGSATASLMGNRVQVRNLTIENTFDPAAHPEIGAYNTQAVALRATGDRQVFRNVRLLGTQDTLNADARGNITADGSGYPRQYYVDSTIRGTVDYVFGRATAVFERVTFQSSNRAGGVVFAPSHASKNAHGYLVIDSRLSSDNDSGTFSFARPWAGWGDGVQPDNSRGNVTIVNSWMNEGYDLNHPWSDFSPLTWADGRFFEYGNTGPGAVSSADRPLLDSAAAAAVSARSWLAGSDGWDPVVAPRPEAATAVDSLVASPTDGGASLTWADSEDVRVVGYQVAVDGDIKATVTRPRASISGLTNGQTVNVSVTAVLASGELAPASTVTVTPELRVDAVVGAGGYDSLASAVAAAPSTGTWTISVRAGTYEGVTTINRSNVTILGEEGAELTNGTRDATLVLNGSDITVDGLTVSNTSGLSNSPALLMTGNRIRVVRSTLVGTDRTVWADVPTAGATSYQIIQDSSITGTNNVILGRATLAVVDSVIHAHKTSGLLLVPSTTAVGGRGFLVLNSQILPGEGIQDVRLGGGYAQGATDASNAPQAWIVSTEMGSGIKSNPWMDFNGFAWTVGRFAEYGNTGPGAFVNDSRPQLSDEQAAGISVTDWLGGWEVSR